MDDLFRFRPDPDASRLRMIGEARRLLAWAQDGTRHQPALTSTRGNLHKFYLAVTFRCPLRCPFCFADGGVRKTDELGADRLLQIVRDSVSACFRELVVTGGEPLAYPEIDAFLRGLSTMERGSTRFVLRTSFGFPISEERMKLITGAFDEITVSIDGDEARHDSIRGKGVYRLTLGNLRRCAQEGKAALSLASVMTKEDFEGLPGRSVLALAENMGIRRLAFRAPVPLGRADSEKYRSAPYFEWRMNRDDPYAHALRPRFSCGFGSNLYMEPDGSCYPCYAWCEWDHRLGDLSKQELSDILSGSDMLACLNCGVDTNQKCRTCEVRYLCGGPCRLWYRNRSDPDSGDFDCSERKKWLSDRITALGAAEQSLKSRPGMRGPDRISSAIPPKGG